MKHQLASNKNVINFFGGTGLLSGPEEFNLTKAYLLPGYPKYKEERRTNVSSIIIDGNRIDLSLSQKRVLLCAYRYGSGANRKELLAYISSQEGIIIMLASNMVTSLCRKGLMRHNGKVCEVTEFGKRVVLFFHNSKGD